MNEEFLVIVEFSVCTLTTLLILSVPRTLYYTTIPLTT